jgi:ABC-type dipeptide/oligopeptide/nickel transport system permease component
MLRFILTRLAMIIPTFIGVTIAAFAFVRLLPGDPVLLMAGERGLTEERYAALMEQFGYDRPLWRSISISCGVPSTAISGVRWSPRTRCSPSS